jgi:transcriptional regulator with XRE-family HTH domain
LIPSDRPPDPRRVTGAEIKTKRKAAGLSQTALAEKVGVTQGAVPSWDIGRAEPRRELMEALEQTLSGQPLAMAAPTSQRYGEWRRARGDAAGLTRKQLAAGGRRERDPDLHHRDGRTLNRELERAPRASAQSRSACQRNSCRRSRAGRNSRRRAHDRLRSAPSG